MCLIVDMGQFRLCARRTNADGLGQFPSSMTQSLVRLFVLCRIYEQLISV
jgi:hypothetical protein